MPSSPNISEYRIVLPMTVQEYQVAQLWSVAEASKNETGGGEGIEVLKNEPFSEGSEFSPPDTLEANGEKFTEGQYTHKIYHLASRVPGWLRLLAPKGSLEIHEKAWNAYPYCRTIVTNPDYMKDAFYIKIETFHSADRGTKENVHGLEKDDLQKRSVVHIDISEPITRQSDNKPEWDPTKVRSEKTGRGPLKYKSGGEEKSPWIEECEPVMCAYKLVTCKFKWFGVQNRVEKFIQTQEQRIFRNFHRQVFCWMDKWHGYTMEDIRRIEEETKKELDRARGQGEIRGTTCKDDDGEEQKSKGK